MGCTDEHGTICHHHLELCPINGVGMLLWAMFHLQHLPVPNFVPDFSNPNYGKFGHQEWYEIKLFFLSKLSPMDLMQYKSECRTSSHLQKSVDMAFLQHTMTE
jgi:hypothetical protein